MCNNKQENVCVVCGTQINNGDGYCSSACRAQYVAEYEAKMNEHARVCGWCGASCVDEFCCHACEIAANKAMDDDMASMPQEPLYVAHGDAPAAVCPICEERVVVPGTRTCDDANCKDCWQMAWDVH